jgi:tRNA pseudouridine32 synthase/23S rRNA pseudouridine746 synthase/23S rRNA pseudouridine1911/1915/1917 synthase
MSKDRHNKWVTLKIKQEQAGMTIEEILKEVLMISNRMRNRLTRMNGIRLNGKNPYLKQKVKKGDRLKVAIRPWEEANLPAHPVPFSILYEDEDLMVVDKPAGVHVHPIASEDHHSLCNGITYHFQQQGFSGVPRPIHRLDRFTSGLILVAKNAYMHQLLDRLLRNREIKRYYLAICENRLPEPIGTIPLPITRAPHHPIKRMVHPDGDPAITHYQVLAENEEASLVLLRLETGRTHQIRVHLSHLGCPLIGDSLYGGKTESISRQALHAFSLSFTHPLTQQPLAFFSSLPEDLNSLLQVLHFPSSEQIAKMLETKQI